VSAAFVPLSAFSITIALKLVTLHLARKPKGLWRDEEASASV
jgi:hypothetical protein